MVWECLVFTHINHYLCALYNRGVVSTIPKRRENCYVYAQIHFLGDVKLKVNDPCFQCFSTERNHVSLLLQR